MHRELTCQQIEGWTNRCDSNHGTQTLIKHLPIVKGFKMQAMNSVMSGMQMNSARITCNIYEFYPSKRVVCHTFSATPCCCGDSMSFLIIPGDSNQQQNTACFH